MVMTPLMKGEGQGIDRNVGHMDEPMLISYDEQFARHQDLLSEIVAGAESSAVYKGRIGAISRLEDLSKVPLTSYLMMDQAIELHGLDACLLRAPDHTFKTSGSTGNPKRMFYSQSDVDRVAKDFAVFCRIVGINKGTSAGTLAAHFPMSPGRSWTGPVMWQRSKG